MYKIFYDTRCGNKIMGMSDGEVVMEFPYVETDTPYHSLKNLKIDTSKSKPEIILTKVSYNE